MHPDPVFSRRDFVKSTSAAALVSTSTCTVSAGTPNETTSIGTRRELFVENTLISQIHGGAQLRLHQPVPREVSFVCDKPWEGATCNYMKVFQDGDLYRMYYRGSDVLYTKDGFSNIHPETACYAESHDGIHWKRPDLDLFEYEGSRNNNIIWMGRGSHNFAPFLDSNPDCPVNQRFKALAGSSREGLLAFSSADGVQFKPLSEKSVIAQGAFDSLNLAFWDTRAGVYREYHRDFRNGRDIRMGTSKNFLNWTNSQFLSYETHRHEMDSDGTPPVQDADPDNQLPGRVSQLYTNQITPYHRAPHLYLGFPTRYIDRGWTYSATQLPRYSYRKLRGASSQREGTAVTDGMFMASRNATHFHVWPESFIRPGLRTQQSWFYGDIYQNHGLVETQSEIEDSPSELSVYVTENSHQEHPGQFRRYTLRLDGFVSLTAPLTGGELTTEPIQFEGNRLELNLSTSAAGSVQVEVQDTAGKPIPGYALADSHVLYGDSLHLAAAWKQPNDSVAPLAGKPIRLRFVIRDADLFSYRFQNA